ncbi:MAG: DUF6870 family protein [Coprococcus sp.]
MNRIKRISEKAAYMMENNLEETKTMAEVDIRTVDINTLTDIRDIHIDTKMSVKDKLSSFAQQTNNIYIHRIGDYAVKVRFQKEGPDINDKMEEYLRHIAERHI